jgi:hypothetical protein
MKRWDFEGNCFWFWWRCRWGDLAHVVLEEKSGFVYKRWSFRIFFDAKRLSGGLLMNGWTFGPDVLPIGQIRSN